MKTTVKEFKAFIDDDEFWPKYSHYNYESFTVNGINVDDDNSGLDDDNAVIVINEGTAVIPLDHFFVEWRKKNESN